MEFKRITAEKLDLVGECKDQAERMTLAALRLTGQLAEFFKDDYPTEYWGTAFTANEDSPGAEFKTPFGDAQVVVSIGLGSEGVQARYVFEKKVADEHGKPAFEPVWAVRITPRALVRAYTGDEVLLDLNAHSKDEIWMGLKEIAHSALYAIANCEKY